MPNEHMCALPPNSCSPQRTSRTRRVAESTFKRRPSPNPPLVCCPSIPCVSCCLDVCSLCVRGRWGAAFDGHACWRLILRLPPHRFFVRHLTMFRVTHSLLQCKQLASLTHTLLECKPSTYAMLKSKSISRYAHRLLSRMWSMNDACQHDLHTENPMEYT